MGLRAKLLSSLIILTSLFGCASKNFSDILDPTKLKVNSQKGLIEYSSELGSVNMVSKNHFRVKGECRSQKGECPVDKYVIRFYRAYCENNGGILNPKMLVNEKIQEANKRLDERTQLLSVPEYYKRIARDYKVTLGDLTKGLLTHPQFSCFIPSKKEIYFVNYNYRCFRENQFWIKCPYTINVYDFPEKDFNSALEKAIRKELKIRKQYITTEVEREQSTVAYASSFETPNGLKFRVFLYPTSRFSNFAKLFVKVTNKTNREKVIALSKLNVVEVISNRAFPSLQVVDEIFFSSWGDCKRKGKYSFIVFPKGTCKIEMSGLKRIEYPIKYIGLKPVRKIRLVIYDRIKAPFMKKISLYDVRKEM